MIRQQGTGWPVFTGYGLGAPPQILLQYHKKNTTKDNKSTNATINKSEETIDAMKSTKASVTLQEVLLSSPEVLLRWKPPLTAGQSAGFVSGDRITSRDGAVLADLRASAVRAVKCSRAPSNPVHSVRMEG